MATTPVTFLENATALSSTTFSGSFTPVPVGHHNMTANFNETPTYAVNQHSMTPSEMPQITTTPSQPSFLSTIPAHYATKSTVGSNGPVSQRIVRSTGVSGGHFEYIAPQLCGHHTNNVPSLLGGTSMSTTTAIPKMSAPCMTSAPPTTSGAGFQQKQQQQQSQPPLKRPNLMSYTEQQMSELNKWLQQMASTNDHQEWEHFSTAFFTDDANLTAETTLDDGQQQRYTIKRSLIGKFFSTWHEAEVVDLSFQLKNAQEIMHESYLMLDCKQCRILRQFDRSGSVRSEYVYADVRLSVVFSLGMENRIKSWNMLLSPTTMNGIPKGTLRFLEEFALKKKFTIFKKNMPNIQQKPYEIQILMPQQSCANIPQVTPIVRAVELTAPASTYRLIEAPDQIAVSNNAKRVETSAAVPKTAAKRKNDENIAPDAKRNFMTVPTSPLLPSTQNGSDESFARKYTEIEQLLSDFYHKEISTEASSSPIPLEPIWLADDQALTDSSVDLPFQDNAFPLDLVETNLYPVVSAVQVDVDIPSSMPLETFGLGDGQALLENEFSVDIEELLEPIGPSVALPLLDSDFSIDYIDKILDPVPSADVDVGAQVDINSSSFMLIEPIYWDELTMGY